MAVYIVTGKLGNGKTLVTVGRIRDALLAGCRVATNLDINLVNMLHRKAKDVDMLRIPDKPTITDLEAIGRGYTGAYNEDKFGLLVLDECGTWFNSRNWQDKSRAAVNEWFLYARKMGWHVYLIIQDLSLLDSQAREALAEFLVSCRRLDNLRVPLIGAPFKLLTGTNLKLPRIHRAKVTYGTDRDLVSDVWVYRGNGFFSMYNTAQIFRADYPHGTHCILPPWHTHGRYAVDMNWGIIMRLTKIYWRRFSSPVSLATGLLLGAFLAFLRFAPAVGSAQHDHAPAVVQSVYADALIGRLSEFRIRGYSVLNSDYRYEFSSPERPEGYYTDGELVNAGVTLAKHGPCRVDAYYRGQMVSIFCM